MTPQRDPDAILATWLEDGPSRLPDATRRAIAVSTATTPQARRPVWSSRRYPFVNSYARLAITALVVVVVGTAGLALLGPGMSGLTGSTGPSPSHTAEPSAAPTSTPTNPASATPSPSLGDTSTWVPYTSTRYGYTISHPPSWTAEAADRDATATTPPVDTPDSSADRFIDPSASYGILVTAFAERFTSSPSVDDWVNRYYEPSTPQEQQCSKTIDVQPITIDGHVGRIATNDPCAAAEAFVLVDGRIYGFGVWRENQEPLFRTFLSTVRFRPGGPAGSLPAPSFATPAPSLGPGWNIYHSNLYGFDMGYPAGWSVAPASRSWTYAADATDWLSPAHDAFIASDQSVRVSAWSVPIDQGTTLDDRSQLETWVQSYCQQTRETPCTGIPARAVPLCLERRDCHPGLLVPFAEDTLAFFTGGIAPEGKVVVVAVWRPESDGSVAPYGGAQHLLEAFLSTMNVWPESVPLFDRKVLDVPGPSSTP